MLSNATCRIEHKDGSLVADNVSVRLDEADLVEVSSMKGESPYDVYDCIIHGLFPSMKAGDALIALTGDVDPVTGQMPRYRVIGRPTPYTFTQHMETKVAMYRGT